MDEWSKYYFSVLQLSAKNIEFMYSILLSCKNLFDLYIYK